MSSDNPFISIQVQPSYGRRKVIVSWVLADGFDEGEIFVYRSNNGVAPWDLVSPEDPGIRNSGSFEDEEFVINNKVQLVHYKLVLEQDGNEYVSPSVTMLGSLTKAEYGAVRKMMKLEITDMRLANGLEVLYYIPLESGTLNPDYDPVTGQRIAVSCPSTDTGYGQKYIGGYGQPVRTYMKISDSILMGSEDQPDGTGIVEDVKVKVRLLAHPRPRSGHLIIHPPTDNRYIVDKVVMAHMFRGLVATAYDTSLILLNRTDPRYKLPVPFPYASP